MLRQSFDVYIMDQSAEPESEIDAELPAKPPRKSRSANRPNYVNTLERTQTVPWYMAPHVSSGPEEQQLPSTLETTVNVGRAEKLICYSDTYLQAIASAMPRCEQLVSSCPGMYNTINIRTCLSDVGDFEQEWWEANICLSDDGIEVNSFDQISPTGIPEVHNYVDLLQIVPVQYDIVIRPQYEEERHYFTVEAVTPLEALAKSAAGWHNLIWTTLKKRKTPVGIMLSVEQPGNKSMFSKKPGKTYVGEAVIGLEGFYISEIHERGKNLSPV